MDDDWEPTWDEYDQRRYESACRPGKPVVYACYHHGDWGFQSETAYATLDEAVAAMRRDLARGLVSVDWIATATERWDIDDDGTLIPYRS